MKWLKDIIHEKYPEAKITIMRTEGLTPSVTVETDTKKLEVIGIPRSPDDKQLIGQVMLALEEGFK